MWVFGDAIAKVRQLLQDESAPYRHSDNELMGYFNSAVSEIRRLRPDLLLPNIAQFSQELVSETDMDKPIPIEDSYFMTLVDYAVGYASMQDDEFATDGKAVAMMTRFTTRLIGKGV